MTIALVAVLVAVTIVSLAVIVFLGRSVRHWTVETRRLTAIAEHRAAELRDELARRGLTIDEGAPEVTARDAAGTAEPGPQEEPGPQRARKAGPSPGSEPSERRPA